MSWSIDPQSKFVTDPVSCGMQAQGLSERCGGNPAPLCLQLVGHLFLCSHDCSVKFSFVLYFHSFYIAS